MDYSSTLKDCTTTYTTNTPFRDHTNSFNSFKVQKNIYFENDPVIKKTRAG